MTNIYSCVAICCDFQDLHSTVWDLIHKQLLEVMELLGTSKEPDFVESLTNVINLGDCLTHDDHFEVIIIGRVQDTTDHMQIEFLFANKKIMSTIVGVGLPHALVTLRNNVNEVEVEVLVKKITAEEYKEILFSEPNFQAITFCIHDDEEKMTNNYVDDTTSMQPGSSELTYFDSSDDSDTYAMSGESQEEYGESRLHVLAKFWLLSNMVQKQHKENPPHYNVLAYLNIVQMLGAHPPSSWNLGLINDVFFEFLISSDKKNLSSSFSKNDNMDHNGANNNDGVCGTSGKRSARIRRRGARNGGGSNGGGGGDGGGSGGGGGRGGNGGGRGRGRGGNGGSGSGSGGGGGGGDDGGGGGDNDGGLAKDDENVSTKIFVHLGYDICNSNIHKKHISNACIDVQLALHFFKHLDKCKIKTELIVNFGLPEECKPYESEKDQNHFAWFQTYYKMSLQCVKADVVYLPYDVECGEVSTLRTNLAIQRTSTHNSPVAKVVGNIGVNYGVHVGVAGSRTQGFKTNSTMDSRTTEVSNSPQLLNGFKPISFTNGGQHPIIGFNLYNA